MISQSVIKRTLLVLVGGFFLCGCVSVNMDLADIEHPVCLNDPTPVRVLVIKHFEEDIKAHFGFFGLVTWSQPPLKEVLEEQMEKHEGNGIVNISIRSGFAPVDVVLGLPFFPLWFPCTYTVEGDVVIIQSSQ